jgi:hypothetical protein
LVTDTASRRQPVGALAVGTDAVWTLPLEGGRLWRVPLVGGPARALRVAGFPHGLAVDAGAVWVRSGIGDPDSEPDRTGRLQRLDQRTGEVTATTPLPDLNVSRAVGPVLGGGLSGWAVHTRVGCTVAASCCGSGLPPGRVAAGFATRAGPSRVNSPAVRMGVGGHHGARAPARVAA